MRTLTIFLLILALAQLACSSSGEQGDQDEMALLSFSTSTDNPQPVSLAAVQYNGEASIEERIIRSDAIVIARLNRTTNEVVTGSGGTYDGKYFPAMKFHLTVREYLKSSGGNNITALWIRRDPYDTRQEAADVVPHFVAGRDTTWDGREAILFLTKEADLATRGDNFFGTEVRAASDYITMDFSLHSKSRKLWLPSAGTGGTGDSQEFLLAVPEAGVTTPVITIGKLKSRIATVDAELDAGDGSDAFRHCLNVKYRHVRIEEFRATQSNYTGPSFRPEWDGSFPSGQPTGAQLYEYGYGYLVMVDGTEEKTGFFLDGDDAALFSINEGAHGPGRHDNERQFSYFVVSTRPIPTGTYNFNHHYDGFLGCEIYSTFEMTATVVAPEGVLHELFFDPVTVGSTVAADDTDGVLKPATFTSTGGASATIESIAWEPLETDTEESGTVKLEINPVSGNRSLTIDFIALDGTVSLTLNAADATVDAVNNTLSWSLESQPWENGDLLMLRIRDSSGVTVALSPKADIFATRTDITVEWIDSATCADDYFVAVYNNEELYSVLVDLGRHSNQATSTGTKNLPVAWARLPTHAYFNAWVGVVCTTTGWRVVGKASVESGMPNNPATGVPTISGTAQAGETLTTSTSGIADTDIPNSGTV